MIADRQTHTETDALITILRSPIGGGVIIGAHRSRSLANVVENTVTVMAWFFVVSATSGGRAAMLTNELDFQHACSTHRVK